VFRSVIRRQLLQENDRSERFMYVKAPVRVQGSRKTPQRRKKMGNSRQLLKEIQASGRS